MTNNIRDEIIDWLRDAYAMERGLEVSLKRMSESDQHCAEWREAAAEHLTDTRRHVVKVEGLLKSLGSKAPTLKTGTAIVTEPLKGVDTSMTRDERIKDLLTSYAMEHFEIVCYRALISAAETAGLPEVAEVCQEIIVDEERMAEAIYEHLPDAVQEHLAVSNAA
jgi:ferritin-like metal-binding protein YciE